MTLKIVPFVRESLLSLSISGSNQKPMGFPSGRTHYLFDEWQKWLSRFHVCKLHRGWQREKFLCELHKKDICNGDYEQSAVFLCFGLCVTWSNIVCGTLPVCAYVTCKLDAIVFLIFCTFPVTLTGFWLVIFPFIFVRCNSGPLWLS